MRFLLKALVCAVLVALCSCESVQPTWLAKMKGRADARADLRKGKLAVEIMGPPPPAWEETYTRLLKERHGIERDWVAGCVVNNRILGHAFGYNEVMEAEIEKRFGADVWERAEKEAQQNAPQ